MRIKPGLEKIEAQITPDQKRQLKSMAALDGKTMAQLVADIIRDYVVRKANL